jgi:septal ring factor EnvC (AmiA/AmiB activator)
MKFLHLLFLIFIINITFGQSQKQKLQKEYKALQNEIRQLEADIKKRKALQNISIKEIEVFNQKIETRKKLIQNTENQLQIIQKELGYREQEVDKNKKDAELYKKEYTKLILWQYKNLENNYTNKLAFLLESSNFREAWNRIKYIRKYTNYTKKQTKILENIIGRMQERVEELKKSKIEKANVVESNKQNQVALEVEKNKRDMMVKNIGAELEDLKKKIAEKNRAAINVNNRIKQVIEEEIRKQRERDIAKQREIEEKRKNNPSAKKPSSVEEIYANSHNAVLSSSFLGSKGSLPLPVKTGVVVSRFGRQPHPIAPELIIENNGIDIKTSNNADVLCMYNGKVVQIFDMPNYETSVLVKHGDYFTLYSHLSSVNVSIGSEVNARQNIGKCAYSSDLGYAFTHIQIWHFSNKQNPSSWIKGV